MRLRYILPALNTARPSTSASRIAPALFVLSLLALGGCASTAEAPEDGGTPPVGDASTPPGECTADPDCDDGDPCNGAESCNAERMCVRDNLPLGGTSCEVDGMEGVCRGRDCVIASCGNGIVDAAEQCDDGNENRRDGCTPACRYTCESDADCADGTVCNGEETCDLSTHQCSRGEPLDCRDGSRCTEDSCDPARGCRNRLIDMDRDGHASTELGRCGDDCDDSNPQVYPGAAEVCEAGAVDNNCDGNTSDEGIQNWWGDCDGDGYAVASAPLLQSCELPAPFDCGSGLMGTWTTRSPENAFDIDCNDRATSVHPRADEVLDDGIDQDCDGGDTCYLDLDDDGYRAILTLHRDSVDLDCNDPFEARFTDPTGDCCELDDRVFPMQNEYFSEPSECNNFDYDCSISDDPRWTEVSTTRCDVGAWNGPVPACGVEGDRWSDCDLGPRDIPTAPRTQECR